MATSPKRSPKFWDIPGLTGYVVDSLGSVYSIKRWRKSYRMAEQINRYGYPVVHVRIEGKSCTVPAHRLVCLAHHGESLHGEEVRHLDGSRTNNHPSNLEWASRAENAKDRARHGTNQAGENGRKATAAMLADGRLTRRANGTFQYRRNK